MVDLILAEFRKLKQEPLSEEELTRAKDQVKGNILMGLESSNARMANLARQEMYFHEFITVDEIIARIGEVSAAQVQAMAQRLFDPERIAVTLLGRLDGVKLERASGWIVEGRKAPVREAEQHFPLLCMHTIWKSCGKL